MIQEAGFDPSEHRKFIKNYFSGNFPGSPAMGALFAVNPKSGDARISGTLASLCGLEYALKAQDEHAVEQAIQKVVMMQAHSFFIGGIPMLFYGDELGTLNDYSYTQDEGKSYDNRWMHRPLIRWEETNYRDTGTVAGRVFNATKRLIDLRKRLAVLTDKSNLDWMTPHNVHIAGFVRWDAETRLYALFNFSAEDAWLTWFAFFEKGLKASQLKDHCTGRMYRVGTDAEYLVLPPYGFMLLEAVD
jgi:amylosucrase